MDEIKNKYKPFPFWSWNDELDETELTRQIEWMHENGIGGFFMHARGGLTTPYLGEKWFSCIEACLKKAKELDMEAYAYDENGWPSGFVGGKLLEDDANKDAYLEVKYGPYDKNALVSYENSNSDSLKRVTSGDNCMNIYMHLSTSTADICNKDVVRKFINLTHEQYKKHDIYKNLRGFFTDEPQYYRWGTPWTRVLPTYYKETYNEDILDSLGLLFVEKQGYREFRFRYWKAMQTLMLNAFGKQIYTWCEENGYKLTGHYVEESSYSGQLSCCAGIMPFYEYEHIPGIDWLGRNIPESDLSTKQLSSVASQLGKEQSMAEAYAMIGWDATPLEIKRITNYLLVGGVNIICHHLMPYSEHGQRKRDYPQHYSPINPWVNKAFKEMNDHYSEIGMKLSQSKEICNIGILSSLSSYYFDYKRELDGKNDEVAKVDFGMFDTLNLFSNHQIQYNIIDETLLEKYGSVKGSSLIVGKCKYDYLVIPYSMYTMDTKTEEFLHQYVSNGGKILLLGDKPKYIRGQEYSYDYLVSNISFDDLMKTQPIYSLKENKQIKTNLRIDEKGNKFIYIVNLGKETSIDLKIDGFISLKCNDKSYPTHLEFNECEDKLLYLSNDEISPVKKLTDLYLDGSFKVSEKVNNYLTIDSVSYSKDNGVTFTNPRNVMAAFNELLESRFNGELILKYTFKVQYIPNNLIALIEEMHIKNVYINGIKIQSCGNVVEKDLLKFDIKNGIKIGENILTIEMNFFENDDVYYALYGENVQESLRNCLAYPTTIEAIYLQGDFGIKADLKQGKNPLCLVAKEFEIVEQKTEVSDLLRDGFLFFRGDISLEKDIEVNDVNTQLVISHRFQLIDVIVNGKFAGRMMHSNKLDLSNYLKLGKNTIKLVLIVGNRNLLGPFHSLNEEDFGVGPFSWERIGLWKDGKADNFQEEYAFVKTFLYKD